MLKVYNLATVTALVKLSPGQVSPWVTALMSVHTVFSLFL